MVVVNMIYMLPMLLGRTYDMKNDTVGVDIFRQEDVDKPNVVNIQDLHSEYRRIEDFSETNNLLKVSGELSLKLKSGKISIGGSGSYFKQDDYKGDVVEILTVLVFKTVSKSLPKSAVPILGWEKFPAQDLGTHYVSEITYGGNLLASLKFRAVDKKYMQDIKAAVDGALKTGSAFDLKAAGQLEKLQKDLKSRASLEITYFATVPLKGVSQTVEGLRDLINGFQDHVKEVNDGIGVPIIVELTELSTLSKEFSFMKHPSLDNKLKTVGSQFDDLLQTESAIKDWLAKRGKFLTEDQEKEVDSFYTKIKEAIAIFKEGINNIDIEKGPMQLNRIIEVYKMGESSSLPGKFRRIWEKMQESMIILEPSKDDANSIYIRWGRTTCNGQGTQILSKGYMAMATNEGSPPNPMCLPEEPSFVTSNNQIKRKIAGVRYGVAHLDPFTETPNLFDTAVRCAICYVKERNTLVDLPMNRCPEKWEMEYKGYYLAGRKDSPKSETVCVDETPETFEMVAGDNRMEKFILAVTHDDQIVPCVVCSK